jgi:hypothetical protein
MTRASLAITCGLLLVLQGCSDVETAGFATATASLSTGAFSTAASFPGGRTGAAPTDRQTPLPAVGIYDIDLAVTKRHAGFLAGLIESKVRGSTLELRADNTYMGRKNGKPESAGTWSMERGAVILQQTHENGEPVTNRGVGTLESDGLSVETIRHGLTIHLVFQRRS